MTTKMTNGNNDPKLSPSALRALAESLARFADEGAARANNFVFEPRPDLAKEFRIIEETARSVSASFRGPIDDETSAGNKPASPEEFQRLAERLTALWKELVVNAKHEDSEAEDYYHTTDLAIEEINDEGSSLLEAARACFPVLDGTEVITDLRQAIALTAPMTTDLVENTPPTSTAAAKDPEGLIFFAEQMILMTERAVQLASRLHFSSTHRTATGTAHMLLVKARGILDQLRPAKLPDNTVRQDDPALVSDRAELKLQLYRFARSLQWMWGQLIKKARENEDALERLNRRACSFRKEAECNLDELERLSRMSFSCPPNPVSPNT